MFCDLAGSTALAARPDPGQFREIARPFQGACAQRVSGFDGYTAQYLGDGGIDTDNGYDLQPHHASCERSIRRVGLASAGWGSGRDACLGPINSEAAR
jgi:hypothetical protein